MKKIFFCLFLFIINFKVISQQSYSVSWGNANYDTLTNFTSILDDILMSPLIGTQEVELNFGFNFPFFDSLYNSIIVKGDGVAYFPDGLDYNMFLFSGEYQNHLFSGLPIHSDWRFISDSINGLNVLKVEWRNVGIEDDVTDSIPTNHRINFQTWFFANGVIEIHFGEIDLANTSFYSDTSGFIWSDGESYGPWVGIANNDLSKVYFVSGTNTNISVMTTVDSANIFYDIPPYGRYFRFTPTNITGVYAEAGSLGKVFSIYPNPSSSTAFIKYYLSQTSEVSLRIYDALGETVMKLPLSIQTKGVQDYQLECHNLPSGLYLVELNVDGRSFLSKIIRH